MWEYRFAFYWWSLNDKLVSRDSRNILKYIFLFPTSLKGILSAQATFHKPQKLWNLTVRNCTHTFIFKKLIQYKRTSLQVHYYSVISTSTILNGEHSRKKTKNICITYDVISKSSIQNYCKTSQIILYCSTVMFQFFHHFSINWS